MEDVWKIPNRTTHIPLTERENTLLSDLQSSNTAITSTLPNGEQVESRFGPVRKENPVDGRPLDENFDKSPQSFQRVLRTGFDWLAEFQQTFRTETVVRSPTEIRDDLRFEPAGLEPPKLTESVETFKTPVHGDFISSNIHVSDGSVTTVIDWEYGARAASPVIDAGWLLIDTATRITGDYTEAVQTILCAQNEYADRARTCVHEYCDAVGLPYRSFELYLPSAFLHRVKLDWQVNAVNTYTDETPERARRAEYLFDVYDKLEVANE